MSQKFIETIDMAHTFDYTEEEIKKIFNHSLTSYRKNKGGKCLMGKNGAGKSTILKLIMNLVKPNSGRIEVFGQSVSGDDENWKKYRLPTTNTYRI